MHRLAAKEPDFFPDKVVETKQITDLITHNLSLTSIHNLPINLEKPSSDVYWNGPRDKILR